MQINKGAETKEGVTSYLLDHSFFIAFGLDEHVCHVDEKISEVIHVVSRGQH